MARIFPLCKRYLRKKIKSGEMIFSFANCIVTCFALLNPQYSIIFQEIFSDATWCSHKPAMVGYI